MQRTVIKIAGESGMGLASVGKILSRALKGIGFYVNSDREYPSLIQGGHSNVQIDFATQPLRALSMRADMVVALDRAGLLAYVESVRPGGVLIHGYERHAMIKDLEERAKKAKVTLLYLPIRQIAARLGGREIVGNMVLLGLLWRVLGFDLKLLEAGVTAQFKHKPKLLEIDLKCIRTGYSAEGAGKVPQFKVTLPKKVPATLLLDGNHAIALGAIRGGTRAYYAYPMSPASSILTHMANHAHATGMVVKQAEDEITAVQMALGSMFAGTRALVATSGGGFDLMTETVSLAGMIECPLVIVIAQRPGPATGLPTWTAQGDLNLAVHSAHGEFARVVLAASDPESCYRLAQTALNLAEVYQVPVLLLTEKVIAETETTVAPFKNNIPLERGLITDAAKLKALTSDDRFKITKSGVSSRWLPGFGGPIYYANSDEHLESGILTEEADAAATMLAKRLRKQETIQKALPEPVIYGPKTGAHVSLVGWGSTKNAVLDAMDALRGSGITVNYLHYEYLWPLKTGALQKFVKGNKNVALIEGNATGQLGQLIAGATNFRFKKQFLKYNGRPFFVEEVAAFIRKIAKKR